MRLKMRKRTAGPIHRGKTLNEIYERAQDNLYKEYLHRKAQYDKKSKDYMIDIFGVHQEQNGKR